MSVKQVSVNVPQELDDALAALQTLITAIKAGNSVADIAVTELPALVTVIGELKAIPAEVLTQSGLDCLALRGVAIVGALVGLPA